MPNVNVTFAGYTLVLPGAYYVDTVGGTYPDTPPTTPPLCIVGVSYGGASGVPYTFASAQNALSFVRGGPIATLIPLISNPSPSLSGAGLITIINVAQNTPSTLNVGVSGVSSGTTVFALASTNYGPPSNLLQASFGAASVGPGYNVTLKDTYAGTSLTGVNLGTPFALGYVGAGTSGTYTYSATGLSLVSAPSGESLTIPIVVSGTTTVSQLVQAVNGSVAWVAEIVSSTQGLGPASGLGGSTGGTSLVAVSGIPQWSYVTATTSDIVFWFSQFAQAYAQVTSYYPAVSGYLPYGFPLTYFTGATGPTGTVSSNNYASGFNVALTTPAWAVITDSSSPAVQNLGMKHAQIASTPPYGSWRRFFTGSAAGDSISTTTANASALDSYTTCYVYPGIYQTSTVTGVSGLVPGYQVAAMAAAMATGNQIALPLTNKPLSGSGVEFPLTISQINTLQQFGVMPVALSGPNGNVPTIVSDLTTWQVDNNPSNVFTQQVACRWWLAYSMVNAVAQFVGSIASNPTEANILNAAKSCLNSLIFTGGGSNGVLNSWDANSLVLIYTGGNQVAAITVSATLVGQNRFIVETVNLQALNITITVAGQ